MLLTKFATIPSSGGSVWLDGWSYGKKITIPAAKIDEDLTNFPLTVYLNNTNFDFNKCKADGSDIRFTDKNLNQLTFERKEHTYVAGGISYATYNIQVPTISNTADTEVSMWYGNAGAYNTSVEAWQDMTGKALTYNGNVKMVQGADSYASFDGSGDYFSLPNNISDFNFLHQVGTTGKWTAEFMYKANSFATDAYFFDNMRGTPTNNGIYIGVTATRGLYVLISKGAEQWILAGVSSAGIYPNDFNEHNIEVDYDQSLASNNCKFFIDGVLVWQATKSAYVPSTATALVPYIGIYNTSFNTTNGYIYGMRITNGRCRHTANYTPPTFFEIDGADVVFCTNFDTIYDSNYVMVQHMGDSLVDATGNGNNGTATGTTVVNTDYGKARSFNGTSDRIINTAFTIGANPIFTITSLLKAENASIGGATWGVGSDGNAISSYPSNSNQLSFDLYGQTTMVSAETHSATEYFTAQHIKNASSGAFTTSNAKAYINGILTTLSYTRGGSTTPSIASGVAIGAVSYNSPYFGRFTMCEFRLSNIARSDAWIKAESLSLKDNLLVIENIAEKLADIEVPVATTSINITGLNLGKGDEVILVAEILNQGGASVYKTYINGNATDTQYYSQLLTANNTAVAGLRENSTASGVVGSGIRYFINTNIKLANSGYAIFQEQNIMDVGSSLIRIECQYITSTFTSTSITQLTINAYAAGRIGAGSRFQLYRIGRGI